MNSAVVPARPPSYGAARRIKSAAKAADRCKALSTVRHEAAETVRMPSAHLVLSLARTVTRCNGTRMTR
jgi:hypothetical protein